MAKITEITASVISWLSIVPNPFSTGFIYKIVAHLALIKLST